MPSPFPFRHHSVILVMCSIQEDPGSIFKKIWYMFDSNHASFGHITSSYYLIFRPPRLLLLSQISPELTVLCPTAAHCPFGPSLHHHPSSHDLIPFFLDASAEKGKGNTLIDCASSLSSHTMSFVHTTFLRPRIDEIKCLCENFNPRGQQNIV